MTHYCNWCAAPAVVGSHRADGSFDPDSVPVTEDQVEAAMENAKRDQEYRLGSGYFHTKANIALGKHLGLRA